ncbi:MAG: methionine--tRNA ligase [Patescibacteria group bacterium]|nr:methionine--tRNA ligase [Patescibacteria group bacterium]MCL5224388.1 methionine--tRNA ligase [Patescibacteria group bacterium]
MKQSKSKKIYITTAIDYVNDVIHIGHAYQKVVADVLSRHYRRKLGEDRVYFLTGTDEHGQKVEEAARKSGQSVKAFVDAIALADQKEQDALNVSYDRFMRTTDPDHIALVNEFWQRSFDQGDLYLGDFDGLYCMGCEEFKTKSELVDGRCPLHPLQELEVIREKNYFFRWSKYRDFLRKWIVGHPESVLPETRRNEVLAFVDKIEDITVSRKKESVGWGIPVPGDSSQVIYVWFDALINYLTAGLQNGFWDDDTRIIHILGKDNLRWHALLWPAMLQSAGYRLPDTVYAHGFLTLNGRKVSKSLGNIIRPSELVKDFGCDPIRYYLLRYTGLSEDSDISVAKIADAYNADLANGLGNFAARTLALGEQLGKIPAEKVSAEVENKINQTRETLDTKAESFNLHDAVGAIWELIEFGDGYVNTKKPWAITGREEKLRVVFDLVAILDNVASMLIPFLPETSAKITKSIIWEGNSISMKKTEVLFPRRS